MTHPLRRSAALLAALGLVIAACGGDDDSGAPVLDPDEPVEATDDADDTDDTDESADEPADDPVEVPPRETVPDSEQPGFGEGKPFVNLPEELPTEVVITDLIEGEGDPAEDGDALSLHYVGVLTLDGTEFDSSWDRGVPFDVTLGAGGVIDGFDEGLQGVSEGDRRQIDIPSEQAYGAAGAGGVIPPNADITFVVDVLAVTKPITVPDERADPSECPAFDGSSEPQQEFDAYPPFCIDVDATYTAEIVTNFGEMTLELNPAEAPLTVNSFVVLALYHYFDGTECHRAIPGFVVQCGDPTATGTGGPGYRFPDELPQRAYEIGSIAMANSGPDTNGSQFFIITGDQGAGLPPQYSLFGDVVGGLDTTVADLDAVANPENNGQPPLEQIIIESVTISEN